MYGRQGQEKGANERRPKMDLGGGVSCDNTADSRNKYYLIKKGKRGTPGPGGATHEPRPTPTTQSLMA